MDEGRVVLELGRDLLLPRLEDVLRGPTGVIRKAFRESLELWPLLAHIAGKGAGAVGGTNVTSVPLDEMVASLEALMEVVEGMPREATLTVDLQGGDVIVAFSADGEVTEKRYARDEAPWPLRAIIRRMISRTGDGAVTCPFCASVVDPRDGVLWGQWCPTCDVMLVVCWGRKDWR